MKKNVWLTVLLIVLLGCISLSVVAEARNKEPAHFDTSIIEQCWGGDFADGNVRMLGGWYYSDGVVEDEMGHLWGIDQVIEEEDFLLLWIADNHTPNYVEDDIVIKVWREAY